MSDLTPDEIVRRASMMGLCSQTHHEHLMRDATTVRKATLDAAALSARPTGDTAHHWDCRAQDGGTCERYVNGGSCVCRCHDARPTGTFADMDHTGHGRTGDTAEDPVTVGLRRLRERHGYLRPTGDTALENRAYRIIERTANMGFCSQTNHEHLMLDARKVESALASPAPTAAPGLREAAETMARMLERAAFERHYGSTLKDHQSVMPGDLIATCTDTPCPETRAAIAGYRAALAPSTPDEEATRLAAWRGDSDDATVNGFLVADLREYQQACREADRDGSEWPVPPRPRSRPDEEATR